MIKCHICGELLFDWGAEGRKYLYENKLVHKECYYDKLGELVETYPIGYKVPKTRSRYRRKVDVPYRS